MNLRQWGGVAAVGCGATYVFGFAFLLGVLVPAGFDGSATGGAEGLAAVIAGGGMVRLWYVVIYIVNAVLLAVLVAALAMRLSPGAPGPARLTQVFGTIWATLVLGAGMVMNVGLGRILPLAAEDEPRALLLWTVVDLVENGLGGGNEIAGGAWALSLGLAGLASGAMPRVWCYAAGIVGLAGLVTLFPALAEIGGAVFGLGFIALFFWTGAILLRGEAKAVAGP